MNTDKLVKEAQGIISMTSTSHKLWALFSGGKDSIVAAHIASQLPGFAGVIHIRTKTGPASEAGSDYALSIAREMGWKIIEKSPFTTYEILVVKYGFPGPAQHNTMYEMLKERALREAAKAARKESGKNIAYITGIRRAESQRRAAADDIHKQDGIYWISPLGNWRLEHVMEYLKRYNLEEKIYRKSRECLCGAFAKPGEKEEIAKECPGQGEYWGKMLNLALGLDVRWIPDFVDPVRHFERYGSNLVISCVDNHEARKAIHQINGVILGGGNHENSGQICIGNCDDPEQMQRNLDGRDGKYAYLPKEGLLFPELLEPEPVTERQTVMTNASCAELIMEGSQHLLINDWMASVMGSYIYKLLHRQPITSFLTFLNADDFVLQSKIINRQELEVYLGAS